jgi:hypothetical protein
MYTANANQEERDWKRLAPFLLGIPTTSFVLRPSGFRRNHHPNRLDSFPDLDRFGRAQADAPECAIVTKTILGLRRMIPSEDHGKRRTTPTFRSI